MKTTVLLAKLAKLYPHRLAESYDHPGLQVSHYKEDTHKIVLCLDFDDQIYEATLQEKPDLIISHHPFIFGTKMAVLNSDSVKKNLYERLEKAELPIVSYHTNFDNGDPGMNDALVERLGLVNIKHIEGSLALRGGDLVEPMEVHAFAKYAKEKLGVPYGLLLNGGSKMVRNVAIIGGGGWQENVMAQENGYDIYISGDMPHHGRREVLLRHYNYLDLPHEIEHAFMPFMKKVLLSIDPTLDIVIFDHEKTPEVI